MIRTWNLVWLGFVAAVMSGCFNPKYGNGDLHCPDNRCPTGYYCASNGTCWQNGSKPSDTAGGANPGGGNPGSGSPGGGDPGGGNPSGGNPGGDGGTTPPGSGGGSGGSGGGNVGSFKLTVNVTGPGAINGDFSCGGGTCTKEFVAGSVVKLSATPSSKYSSFAGWTNACNNTGDCTVTINADTTVGAVFKQQYFRLSIAFTGAGTVTDNGTSGLNCTSDCGPMVAGGSVVTLNGAGNAAPARTRFVNWGGDCNGSSCMLTMDGDKTVTVRFVNQHKLTVTITGSATCTADPLHMVKSSPAGIDCGIDVNHGNVLTGTCTAYFDEGSGVYLTQYDDANGVDQCALGSGFQPAGSCASLTCLFGVNADFSENAIFRTPSG
jgi:hypothetical protein